VTGNCINCGGLVLGGMRARCVACELDAGLVLAVNGQANCRNLATKSMSWRPAERRLVIIRIEEPVAMPEIQACPICKRPQGQPHDEAFCTPERRANAERDRLAIDPPKPMAVRSGPPPSLAPTEAVSRLFRKETPMPTLAEATAALGLPAPSTGAPVSVEHPIATADCGHCGTKPIGFFTLKLDGNPGKYCDAHRSPKSRLTPAVYKPADSVNETPIGTVAADDQVDVEQLLARVGDDDEDLAGDDHVSHETAVIAAPVIPDAPSQLRTSGPNGDAPLSPDRPQSAAHLRAERERLTAYLQDLDRRIEEAEVFEVLAGKTPAELQQLLDDARRQARLCEIALQGVA
jgi:hypothetical protein